MRRFPSTVMLVSDLSDDGVSDSGINAVLTASSSIGFSSIETVAVTGAS
jgi:hypothetical protein